MGCQNSNSVQPMPKQVLQEDINLPEHKETPPTISYKENVIIVASNIKQSTEKENKSPRRKPSVKMEAHPFPLNDQDEKLLAESMRRKSKSDCHSLEIQIADAITQQNEPCDGKRKVCIQPKVKNGSMKKKSEGVISVGPSCNSIEEDLEPEKGELKNQKMVFDQRWTENQVAKHFEGQPLHEVKTESLGSEKVFIEPFKFQVDKSVKGSQRSLIRQEKEEVGLFMDDLINYQNEHVLQQVINRLQKKEAMQTQSKEPQQSSCNTEKIMHQQILQDEKRMQNELLASISFEKDEPQPQQVSLAANSYNTEKMMKQQILEGQKRIEVYVMNCIVGDRPESQREVGESIAACSITTEKMMQQQILEDQKRMQKEVLRYMGVGSTPSLAE